MCVVKSYTNGKSMYTSSNGPKGFGDVECDCEGNPISSLPDFSAIPPRVECGLCNGEYGKCRHSNELVGHKGRPIAYPTKSNIISNVIFLAIGLLVGMVING